jgi:ABC-type branched-subunit amino acid transport system ATPase component/ABC-type branched-subunit amino acid transport system permease subunit
MSEVSVPRKIEIPAERAPEPAPAAPQPQSRLRTYARWVGPVVGFAVFLVVLSFVEDSYLQRVLALLAFWTAISMAWNLIGGYAGQIFLGNAAFVGLGAYTATILLVEYNVTPWLGFIAAAIVCAGAALLAGLPTLRLTGVYFSLATLSFPLILLPVFTWLGYRELLIPARRDALYALQFRDIRWYAVILAVLVLGTWLLTTAIERSHWSVQLQALRQDEDAARSLGVNAFGLKLRMFLISGVLTGFAGVVYAQMLFVVTPESVFGLGLIIGTLVICFLGGAGRLGGPIVGALIIIPIVQWLETNLGHFAGAANFAYGLVLVVVIILLPTGLVGSRVVARLTGRRVVPPPSAVEIEQSSAVGVDRLLDHEPVEDGGSAVPMLECQGLRKRYGEVIAVGGVDLTVQPGEFIGVVGPNGAGKTTLFDLITGYQEPTEGSVHLRGEDITDWRTDRRARAGIRRTFQIARPLPDLTVFENVLVGAMHQVEGDGESRTAALRALSVVGLIDQADDLARDLGPSQLRLLELARALAGRPTIVLLDEPFAGLDPRERQDFVQVLQACSGLGLTIVLVDHDIKTVAATVQQMVVLNNGVEIARGDPQAVVRDQRVIDAYLGVRWQGA